MMALLFLAPCPPAHCLEPTLMVTYGRDAKTIEGDDDFLQVIFIRIPDSPGKTLYIRIFDADCGGKLDARYTKTWNTRTRFRLFGGKGAYSHPGLKHPTPERQALDAGELIREQISGEDPFQDSRWHTFAEFDPGKGEKIGKFRYFRLVVEGVGGDDGNRFSIGASTSPRRNIPPPGLRLFSYTPTIYLPRAEVFAEMRFSVPKDADRIIAHNFDSSQAHIGVDTAFRSELPVDSSGQDEWRNSSVSFDKRETGRTAAIRFAGGEEIPNDGTFYVTDRQGNLLPFELPVYLHKPNTRPIPRVKTEPLADCRSFLFDGSGTPDPDGDPMKFFWNFGDGNTGEGGRITHTYESPGQYQASLIVEDGSGQVSNSAIRKFLLKVNDPPKPEAGPDIIAAPGSDLAFDGSGSSDSDGAIIRYSWDLGDGYKEKGINVTHAYKRPDTYTVSLRVEDDSKSPCNSATDTLEVWINAKPVVDIGKDRIASVGQELEFSSGKSGDSDGEIMSYEWDMGDGAEKSGPDIVHTYEKPGTYKVRLAVTDNSGAVNGTAGDVLNVFVNDPPVADAGEDQRAAAEEPVIFDASASSDPDGKLEAFTWDFGDGTVSEGKTATHSYERPGQYHVTLTVRDNSGSTTDTAHDEMLVIVNYPPVAHAGDDRWMTESKVHFDGTASDDEDGEIIAYLWDFGDGKTGTGPSPVHVYQNPGTYAVRLTVRDDSGTSSDQTSDEMTVIINHLPIADAGPDQKGTPGQIFVFDGAGSVDPDGELRTFTWGFGDGTVSEGKKTTHSYDHPGRYDISLIVADNSEHEKALGFDEATVTVNARPVAIISSPDTGPGLNEAKIGIAAPGDKIRLHGGQSHDPDGKILSHAWKFFGNPDRSDECGQSGKQTAECTFLKPGVCVAELTVTDNSGVENSTARDRFSIRINHKPVADAGKNIHTNSRRVSLDASGSSDADGDTLIYTWDFGDSTPHGIGEKVFHRYAAGGTYPVILHADDRTGLRNARSTASIRIIVNERPVADAGGDRTACTGKVVIFDGAASGDPEGGLLKYHWDFGDGTGAEGVNPTKTFMKGGVYPVRLTVRDDSGLEGGDTSADQIVVNVAESPVANAGIDQEVCAGTIVQFDGSHSKDTDGIVNDFHWSFGDGTFGSGSKPLHVYIKAGVYRVRLLITGDQAADCDNMHEDEMIVTVHEAPVAEFSCPSVAEPEKAILFDASKSAIRTAQNAALSGISFGTPLSVIRWEWDFGDGTRKEGEKTEHTFAKTGEYMVMLTLTTDSETDCNKAFLQKRITVNAKPVAEAGDDMLAGTGQMLTFNAASSRDPDGLIASHVWDFGDGETGTGIRPVHQYRKPGKYKVRLIVTDNTDLPNNNDGDTLTVTVNAPPVPIISAGMPQKTGNSESGKTDGASLISASEFQVCPGKEVILSAKNSHDADGGIFSHSWHFGDRTPEAQADETRHIWHSPGKYVLTLTTDDGKDVSNSRTQTTAMITVNDSPLAEAGENRVVSPEEDISFDGSGSRDRDGAIVSYQWDFGDGGKAEGQKAKHLFKAPGTYEVRLRVTDNSGTPCAAAEDRVTVRVNAPPVPDAGGDRKGFSGGAHDALLFDAGKSHDPDGDPLTFFWDFGDGTKAGGAKVRHAFGKPGKYLVRLRADDNTGLASGVRWDEITVTIDGHE